MTLLEIAYQRRKTKAEASGLLDKVFNEGRSLTIPEQVRFESLTARMQQLDGAFADREALRKLAE